MSAGRSDFLRNSGLSRFFFASCMFIAETEEAVTTHCWSWSLSSCLLEMLILGLFGLLAVPLVLAAVSLSPAPVPAAVSSSVSGSDILNRGKLLNHWSKSKIHNLISHPPPNNILSKTIQKTA